MPNGGPTPDCSHCAHFVGNPGPGGASTCSLHQMQLISKFLVFCSQYRDPKPDEKGDWLDQKIESRDSLDRTMMYLWIGGYDVEYFHVPLAPISDFATWDRDKVIEAATALRKQHGE